MEEKVITATDCRLALQLTQLEMGELLGVSRTQIALHETGSRSLPAHAMIRLGKLTILLAKKRPALKKKKSESLNYFRNALAENQTRQARASRKLEQAIQAEKSVVLQQDFLNTFGQDGDGDGNGEPPLKARIKQLLNQFDPLAVEKLQLKLEVLKSEEKILKKRIGKGA